MADEPHVTNPGAGTVPARGGACGLYPNRTCVGGWRRRVTRHRTITAARATNRRDRQSLGVGDGELSLCRDAVPFVRGNQSQFRDWERKVIHENSEQKETEAYGPTFALPWATQGVDSQEATETPRSGTLALGQKVSIRERREIRYVFSEARRVHD
jgi:hypothetical protein